jgi:hypothetical protein
MARVSAEGRAQRPGLRPAGQGPGEGAAQSAPHLCIHRQSDLRLCWHRHLLLAEEPEGEGREGGVGGEGEGRCTDTMRPARYRQGQGAVASANGGPAAAPEPHHRPQQPAPPPPLQALLRAQPPELDDLPVGQLPVLVHGGQQPRSRGGQHLLGVGGAVQHRAEGVLRPQPAPVKAVPRRGQRGQSLRLGSQLQPPSPAGGGTRAAHLYRAPALWGAVRSSVPGGGQQAPWPSLQAPPIPRATPRPPPPPSSPPARLP